MNKYQELISKIRKLKAIKSCSSAYFLCQTNQNFSPDELELMEEALEIIQVLEIIFRLRAKKTENHV